jgi:hypothetical protein
VVVRLAAQRRRELVALLVACQAACGFDTGGGAAGADPPDPGSGSPPDAALPGAPDGAAAVAACPESTDLLACLTSDGAAQDGSGYGNPVQVTGSASFAPGIDGQALDATSSVEVTIDETSVLDPSSALLIELWARADSFPAEGGRAGLVDNEGQWGLFVHADGRVSCSMSGFLEVEAVLALGAWANVACGYDGSTLRLFKNGALAGEAAGGTALSAGGSDGTAIGHNSPTGEPFDGLIDEVRIWRRGAL